jgi:hypothetical protein
MCLSIEMDRPESVLGKGEHAGYKWAIVHNAMGYRCGYVRLPKGHPWHGKDYNDIPAEVHGGLTFGEPDKPCDKPGDDDAFWIGFDCGHYDDLPDPLLPAPYRIPEYQFLRLGQVGATIKTQEYVEAECRSLCEQAAGAGIKPAPK